VELASPDDLINEVQVSAWEESFDRIEFGATLGDSSGMGVGFTR
jgi:hypothetical protein